MISAIFKRGVVHRGEFASRCLERERARQGWWPFSYRLLESLENSFTSEDQPLLDRLYASLEAGAGIYKITVRNRFDRLDEKIRNEVKTRFRSESLVRIHDAAASSAVTSIDLFRAFNDCPQVRLDASDYFHRLWLVDVGAWTIAFDEQGIPLQYSGRNMVLASRRPEQWRYTVNRLAQVWVERRCLAHAKQLLDNARSTRQNDHRVRSVALFHPEALELSQTEPRFSLCRHDIFRSLAPAVHILRIMNFLTSRHLDPPSIGRAFRAARESVAPGGLLIIGRNRDESDGALCVSAYEVLADRRCRRVWQLDEPWENESLVRDSILTEFGNQ